MIFQRERWLDMESEILLLAKEEWVEIAWNREKIPLAIDCEKYRMLDQMDKIFCFSGRVNGELKAYNLFFIATHPHYMLTTYAINDVFFVSKQYRADKTGSKFVDWSEQQLKDLGAQTIIYHVKMSKDWSPMLARKGFTMVDTVWQKYLED